MEPVVSSIQKVRLVALIVEMIGWKRSLSSPDMEPLPSRRVMVAFGTTPIFGYVITIEEYELVKAPLVLVAVRIFPVHVKLPVGLPPTSPIVTVPVSILGK
jgi:hypothetical protein